MTARNDGLCAEGGPSQYASSPCLAQALDASGGGEPVDPRQRADVMRWRRSERERLIALRLATPSEDRLRWSHQIGAALDEVLGGLTGIIVSVYSAFRGEPVLRDLMKRIVSQGGRTALPVVVARGQPLVFRAWAPGDPTRHGIWNIPEPTEQAEIVVPDVVIAPVVGFDPACYRLGYGGGFYDRTLASFAKRPRIFAVGYSQAALKTIYPQPHDVPMDAVVTERGVEARKAVQPT